VYGEEIEVLEVFSRVQMVKYSSNDKKWKHSPRGLS